MDTLRYHWHNLNQQITKIVSELILVQDDFRTTLLGNVEQFIEDSSVFVTDYTEVYLPVLYCPLISYTFFLQKGPMVVGIHPREASDRLIVYQV